MPRASELFRAAQAPALFALLAAALGFALWRSPAAEDALVRALNPDGKSAVDGALKALDRHGPRALQGALGLAALAAFALPRLAAARRAALAGLFGLAWSQCAVNALKTVVRRDRPLERPDFGATLREILPVPDVARSFPSGHVATATCVAAGLWLVLGALGARARVRAALLVVPLAMVWDRVAAGLHHPSDACAGAAAGAGAVALAAAILGALGARPAAPARRAGEWPWLVAALALLAFVPRSAAPALGAPVGGGAEGVAFVERAPALLRAALDPLVGPSTHLARYDRFGAFVVAAGAVGAGLVVVLLVARLRFRHGGAAVALGVLAFLAPTWASQFCSGAPSPPRYEASALGVFVDWHLHAGDRIDGRQTVVRAEQRQKARGVAFAVPTCHDARTSPPPLLARGVHGAEWSGGDYPRSKTAHVLALGTAAAVDAALAAKDALDVVRAGKRAGALVLVAHHWRSAATIAGVPTPEAFADAGADGFEVANRYADSDPAFAAAAARIDALCRARGLLRVSFSDDHGLPAGSPCVTWIAGVDARDLEGRGGMDLIRRLRRDADPTERIDADRVVPLVFGPKPAGGPVARVLLFPLEYLRTVGFPVRAAWFAFALAVAFLARRLRVAG